MANYWDRAFPTPDGAVAKLFAQTAKGTQLQQLKMLINANMDRRPQILLSDFMDVFMPFVIAIPGMGRQLKVIYNLQQAKAHKLIQDTQVENNLVGLMGDYIEGVQIPTALVLPSDSLECKRVKCPGGEMFNAKRLDPTLTKPTWFKLGAEDKVALVPSVMPTPAFLVYDSFDGEIGAMVLYERWMTARTHDINAFPKFNIIIQAFLKALVVSTTAKEAQARLNPSIFIQTPPSVVLGTKDRNTTKAMTHCKNQPRSHYHQQQCPLQCQFRLQSK